MKLNIDTPFPLLDPRDVNFMLFDWLSVADLAERPAYADHSVETFNDALDLGAEIAGKKLAPHYKLADANEPFIDADGKAITPPETAEGLRAIFESGLAFADLPEADGGIGLPSVVARAVYAWWQAANVSTSVYAGLTKGNENVIRTYGSPEQHRLYGVPQIEGRFTGTMCLSEPEAGSSLADIKSKAVKRADGTYAITGTKMWITGGDHEMSENIIHLVLAKVPGAPDGVKGISMFIVPKFLLNDDGSVGARNDVALAGLNHKMGNKGATNALISLGAGDFASDAAPDGATGYLVGEENAGLGYMFLLMNEARIGVGLQSAALAYTGYLQTLEYAKTRVQGRLIGVKGDQVPIIAHPDVRRLLLAQKSYAAGALALCLYCARLVDDVHTLPTQEERDAAFALLDLLTPITKSWPAQWGTVANDLAIQVHGGYGYTRDYNVEQLYRDNRLNPIHEGATAIHGLDLLGRKIRAGNGASLFALITKMQETATRAAEVPELAQFGKDLDTAAQRILGVTGTLATSGRPDLSMANANAYLDGVGHVVIAWLWLDQALATVGKDDEFHRGKRLTTRYFFVYELPKAAVWFDLLEKLDDTTLSLDEAEL